MEKHSDTKSEQTSNVKKNKNVGMWDGKRIMGISGYVMVMCSVGLLIFWSFQKYSEKGVSAQEQATDVGRWLLMYHTNDFLFFAGVIVIVFVGMRLLGTAGKGATVVIPDADRELLEPLIKQASPEKGVELYVLLSSLSGFTGTFPKIGFSGLPLATASLTLIFAALSIFRPDQFTQFMDLTKLTLGAFIGSFVQGGKDAAKLPSITVNN